MEPFFDACSVRRTREKIEDRKSDWQIVKAIVKTGQWTVSIRSEGGRWVVDHCSFLSFRNIIRHWRIKTVVW